MSNSNLTTHAAALESLQHARLFSSSSQDLANMFLYWKNFRLEDLKV